MRGTTACGGWSSTSTIYRHEPAFYELDDSYEGFEWIDFGDADNSVISFARKSRDGDVLLFVVNATPVVREGYRVGAPGPGFYQEILNTDAADLRRQQRGQLRRHASGEDAWQGRDRIR